MTTPSESEAPPPQPSPSDLPRWTRTLTHLAALGWATWEIGFGGARLGSFLFIGAVLLGSEGLRALVKMGGLLR